jgi:hypothetical protein
MNVQDSRLAASPLAATGSVRVIEELRKLKAVRAALPEQLNSEQAFSLLRTRAVIAQAVSAFVFWGHFSITRHALL